ncbi:hypothetical protein [Phenylobacterium sp.]|uniref:hypothetical protein n=1 Tax=Phenylobacterium sp. TaxID=1871053 RepID=UPI0035ADA90C
MDERTGSETEAGAARQALARGVSADLDAIFRPPPEAPPPPSGRVRAFAGLREPASRQGRIARWGGLAAAALAGLAVGAVLMDPRAPATAAKPVQIAQAAATPSLPVVVAEAPRPARPPAADLPAPVFTPVPAAPQARPAAPERAGEAKPARVVKAKAKRRPAAGRCEGLRGDNRARCAYPQVLEADRRLRRAYASATRAGVARASLVSYRNRWASLRHRADDQPSRVIAAYSDMARDLDNLARRARS